MGTPGEKDLIDVELELTEELLGTSPASEDVYREFIESRRPATAPEAEDEAEALPELAEELAKATTVFSRTANGKPFIYDYHIKGYLKDACGMLRRVKGTRSARLRAYKKAIDGLVFVFPRQIVLNLDGAEMDYCVRPLRAQTAKGERTALSRSETVPAGTKLRFQLQVLDGALIETIEEWLHYGKLRGLGQWRNSGKGRFTYAMAVPDDA